MLTTTDCQDSVCFCSKRQHNISEWQQSHTDLDCCMLQLCTVKYLSFYTRLSYYQLYTSIKSQHNWDLNMMLCATIATFLICTRKLCYKHTSVHNIFRLLFSCVGRSRDATHMNNSISSAYYFTLDVLAETFVTLINASNLSI